VNDNAFEYLSQKETVELGTACGGGLDAWGAW